MTNMRSKILFPFSLLLFFLFTLTSCDNEEKLYNRWNLQFVSKNGEPFTDSTQLSKQPHLVPHSTYYLFHFVGILEVYASGITSTDGFYEFKDNSTIKMRFTLVEHGRRFEIEAKIKKLTRKELNLEYEEKGDTYFLKLYTN